MLIKYNRPNCHAFGSKDGKAFGVLRPGLNEFNDELWNEHIEDKEVIKLIADGHIELYPLETKGKGKKAVVKFLGEGNQEVHLVEIKDEKMCLDLIKSTLNKDMLIRWMDEETRHKIKRALDAQLKSISPEKESN